MVKIDELRALLDTLVAYAPRTSDGMPIKAAQDEIDEVVAILRECNGLHDSDNE